jgi:hypothetical protein
VVNWFDANCRTRPGCERSATAIRGAAGCLTTQPPGRGRGPQGIRQSCPSLLYINTYPEPLKYSECLTHPHACAAESLETKIAPTSVGHVGNPHSFVSWPTRFLRNGRTGQHLDYPSSRMCLFWEVVYLPARKNVQPGDLHR